MNSSVTFSELEDEQKVQNVQYSHVSVEVGHLYFEDYEAGHSRIVSHFELVKPWFDAVVKSLENLYPSPRISTCFLIDDYFAKFPDGPDRVIGMILEAAHEAGIEIDYVAREAACASESSSDLARILESRIVQDPSEGSNGRRPSLAETGWLANGVRSPGTNSAQAMDLPVPWSAPRQNGARNHSIFLDVELWDESDSQGSRRWSCPYLAAVWQLMRLGLLRDNGVFPWEISDSSSNPLPSTWDESPAVFKTSQSSKSFCAYRTLSIIESRFIPIEHAVRSILGQTAIDSIPMSQVNLRATAERVTVPAEVVDRIGYVFMAEG